MEEFEVKKGRYYTAECDSTHVFVASKDFTVCVGAKRDMYYKYRYFDGMKNIHPDGSFAPNIKLHSIREATLSEIETLNMYIVKGGYEIPEIEVKPNTEFKWF